MLDKIIEPLVRKIGKVTDPLLVTCIILFLGGSAVIWLGMDPFAEKSLTPIWLCVVSEVGLLAFVF